MIGKKFIDEKVKEARIKGFFREELKNGGFSHVEIEKTPVGTKFVVYSSKPGLVVGRGGRNVQELKEKLKGKFEYDSPQIEVREIENENLYPNIVAERIAYQLENWGVTRFKAIGYQNLEKVMEAGAKGAEIIISGLVPGKRGRSWRFADGTIPKSGPISDYEIRESKTACQIPLGKIGIKVRILPEDVEMPDKIKIKDIKKGEENGDSES